MHEDLSSMHEHNELGKIYERVNQLSRRRHHIIYTEKRRKCALGVLSISSVNYITPAKPHFIVLSLPDDILHEQENIERLTILTMGILAILL